MNQFAVPPYANVHHLIDDIRNQIDLDLFAHWNFRYFEFMLVEANASVAIQSPGFAQIENIFAG